MKNLDALIRREYKRLGMNIVHDDALADLAFGFQADFIKCGIATKWREVKLKRLIDIENSIQ